MAAGKVVVPRRGFSSYSGKDFDGYRNHSGGVNGRYISSDVRRNAFSCSHEEQEFWSRDHFFGLEEGEIPDVQNYQGEVPVPAAKKRKFSPIQWGIEEKETVASSKNGAMLSSPSRAPCQGLNGVSGADADKYPVFSSEISVADKDVMAQGPIDVTGFVSSEEKDNFDDRVQRVEEELFAGARNLSLSRWASDDDSPADAVLSDDKVVLTETVYKKSSPEGEPFIGDRLISSVSDESMGFASRDEDSGSELEDEELLDVDKVKGAEIEEPATAMRRSISMLEGCRSVFEYERLNEINEGTYGKVYRARDKKTGEIVALKKVKLDVGGRRTLEEYGFPLSALREINILLSFHHPSIVDVKEVVMGDLDSVFMVMEYVEHDLKGLMQVMKQPFSTSEVKCLMLQLLEGVKYLHDNWVLHRDLKTSNLLLNNKGELKLCDFGMSRQYGSPLKPYTSLVVTLWYRAPELLLGAKQYSTAVDMWSVGCIMAELLTKEPLFKGKTEIDQLDKIFKILGTPNEKIWPGLTQLPGAKANFIKQPYNMLRKKFPATSFTGSPILSDLGLDLLNKLLTYDPEKRITVDDALNHPWFSEAPQPKSKEFMPTFPPQCTKNRHIERTMSSPDSRKRS